MTKPNKNIPSSTPTPCATKDSYMKREIPMKSTQLLTKTIGISPVSPLPTSPAPGPRGPRQKTPMWRAARRRVRRGHGPARVQGMWLICGLYMAYIWFIWLMYGLYMVYIRFMYD